jgi:hypothetical protein
MRHKITLTTRLTMRRIYYPWADMTVGDDFLVPVNLWDGDYGKTHRSVCSAIFARSKAHPDRYKTKMMGSPLAVRVERVS